MRKLLLALGFFLAFAGIAQAQPIGSTGLVAGSGIPPFTGIGDTLSGAKAHFGSIAYSSAKRGSAMYRICDNATVGSGTCKDISTDASTGLVSSTQGVGTVATCDNSTSQCYVDKLYDDSGSNFCNTSNATCDLCAGGGTCTTGTRGKFVVNAVGTLPGVDSSTGSAYTGVSGHLWPTATAGGMALLNAFKVNATITAVDIWISVNGLGGVFWDLHDGGSTTQYKRNNSGTTVATLPANGSANCFIGTDDGAAGGHVSLNNTATAVTVGTGNVNAGIGLGNNTGVGTPSSISNVEYGIYNADVNSSLSALYTTMHANGGC